MVPGTNAKENVLLPGSADGISMALRGSQVTEEIQAANHLAQILHGVLSVGKCRNFLLQLGEKTLRLFKRGDPASRWFKAKDKIRRMAAATKAESANKPNEEPRGPLPYGPRGGFRLLGLTLGNQWAFRD